MANTNYITSIVKILETPKQKLINDKILITEFRAFLPQIKKNKIVNLSVWGEMAQASVNYLKPNDYILVEGFLMLHNDTTSKIKTLKITVLKTYPIFLNYDHLNNM